MAYSNLLKFAVIVFAVSLGQLRATGPDDVLAGLGGALLLGSSTSANKLEQIYYLGTFDPDNRLPPTFFRIQVKGQASMLSGVKFGSGWVPAGITDTLSGQITLDKTMGTDDSTKNIFGPERPFGSALVQYGPEGFRLVPDQQRLVIVMGSSPQAFFDMVDAVTGKLSGNDPATMDASAYKQKIKETDDRLATLGALKKQYTPVLFEAEQ